VNFAAFVITDKKPTPEVLEKTLVLFGPHHQGHWLEWTLGGRYTGNLIPIDRENTATGARPELTDFEKRRDIYGLPTRRQERTGPGVDALQRKNLASVNEAFLPHAVVLQGQWHACEVFSVEALARDLGLEVLAEEREAECAAIARWSAKFEAMMQEIPAENWISVIDCNSGRELSLLR
jgi:hypothetical protein